MNIVSWIAYNDGHNRCYYAETGERPLEIDNPDKGLFDIADSSLSSNSTRLNRGIMPGFVYMIVWWIALFFFLILIKVKVDWIVLN